jgi:hypothetical protein
MKIKWILELENVDWIELPEEMVLSWAFVKDTMNCGVPYGWVFLTR